MARHIVEKGAVGPNLPSGWAAWVIPHLKRLGVRRLQVLVYENPQAQIADLLAIQEAIPGVNVTVRCYAANIITFDPKLWALECRRRVDVLLAAGVNVVGLIPANEFNIEVPEDRPELASDWAYQSLWLQAFARAWHFLEGPFVELHLPALSPAVAGWTAGLDAYVAAGLEPLFHVKDSHCYPGSERAYQEILDRFPWARIAITEFNNIDPETYLASLPPAVETAEWFIIKWIYPPAGSPQVDLIDSPYYESFARAGAGADGGHMSLKEQYSNIFKEWEQAGGVENNFHKHLLAIGAVPAKPADLDFLTGEAASSLAQLKGAMDAYLASLPLA